MKPTPVHHGSNANPNIAPDPFDLDNYCRTCDRTYNAEYIYRSHLIKVHGIGDKLQAVKAALTIKKAKFLPDPMDPNFYCRVCNTKKTSLNMHRRHCRSAHDMVFPALRDFTPFPDAEKDMFSPEHYCAKCDKRIGAQGSFRKHLRRKHNIICRSDEKHEKSATAAETMKLETMKSNA